MLHITHMQYLQKSRKFKKIQGKTTYSAPSVAEQVINCGDTAAKASLFCLFSTEVSLFSLSSFISTDFVLVLGVDGESIGEDFLGLADTEDAGMGSLFWSWEEAGIDITETG